MKRTHELLRRCAGKYYFCGEVITCRVVGEMCDGSKVWEKIDREKELENNQYFLIRVPAADGKQKYYFIVA